jgi:hypothetical protein
MPSKEPYSLPMSAWLARGWLLMGKPTEQRNGGDPVSQDIKNGVFVAYPRYTRSLHRAERTLREI